MGALRYAKARRAARPRGRGERTDARLHRRLLEQAIAWANRRDAGSRRASTVGRRHVLSVIAQDACWRRHAAGARGGRAAPRPRRRGDAFGARRRDVRRACAIALADSRRGLAASGRARAENRRRRRRRPNFSGAGFHADKPRLDDAVSARVSELGLCAKLRRGGVCRERRRHAWGRRGDRIGGRTSDPRRRGGRARSGRGGGRGEPHRRGRGAACEPSRRRGAVGLQRAPRRRELTMPGVRSRTISPSPAQARAGAALAAAPHVASTWFRTIIFVSFAARRTIWQRQRAPRGRDINQFPCAAM